MFYIHCEKDAVVITTTLDDSKIHLGSFIHLENARKYANMFAKKEHNKVIERIACESEVLVL